MVFNFTLNIYELAFVHEAVLHQAVNNQLAVKLIIKEATIHSTWLNLD